MSLNRNCQRVFILLNALCICLTLGQNDSCGVGEIASLDAYSESSNFKLSNRSLLLNLNNSSPCNGTLNTWRFCYLVQNLADVLGHISVGIWRSNDGDTYKLVNDSLTALPDGDLYRMFDFVCQKTVVAPFEAMEGDIAGAIVSPQPATVSIVGSDADRVVWVTSVSVDGDFGLVKISDFNILQNYGLYIEALFTELGDSTTSLTITTSTTIGIEGTAQSQPLWAVYTVAAVSLCLVILLFVIGSLCIAMARQQKRYGKVGGSGQNTTILTNMDMASPVSQHKNQGFRESNHTISDTESIPMSNQVNTLQDLLPSPMVIENTNRERLQETGDAEASKRNKSRAQTFTFPPPETKAPLPPSGADKQHPSDGVRNPQNATVFPEAPYRPLPLSPLSASSLPNLLSDDVYDKVKSPATSEQVVPSPTVSKTKNDQETGTGARKPRAQTFAFPPPEVKAPLPPGEDCDSGKKSNSRKISTPPQRALPPSPMVSASSLPNLFPGEEDTYENVSPSPYMDCASTKQPIANGKVADGDKMQSTSNMNGGVRKTDNAVSVKARVERLQSAPMTTTSPEYAEPISAEQRARFYSYRGLKIPSTGGRKLGAFKNPMPLPSERSQSLPHNNVPSSISQSLKMSDQLEKSLEKITEVEETDTSTLTRGENKATQKGPEVYLEPVKLNSK